MMDPHATFRPQAAALPLVHTSEFFSDFLTAPTVPFLSSVLPAVGLSGHPLLF